MQGIVLKIADSDCTSYKYPACGLQTSHSFTAKMPFFLSFATLRYFSVGPQYSARASMGLLCFTLNVLFLCFCLEASGANIVRGDLRHIMHPRMIGLDTRSPFARRSIDRNALNIGNCSFEMFVQKASSVSCVSNFSQPYVDAYARCGHNEVADLAVDTCRTLNGKTCTALVGAEVNNVISLFTNCVSSSSG